MTATRAESYRAAAYRLIRVPQHSYWTPSGWRTGPVWRVFRPAADSRWPLFKDFTGNDAHPRALRWIDAQLRTSERTTR